ncbi:subtilisin-like protein [Crucibulum laeve]|uniref:tripeptidyl-peptidase II n=1 Tax=Crucibulum laeve TaxID=68775 RepID=A0A5C3LM31_9AGAR|nr:subtilisin-like protein [Crucibulum laeve]
MLTFTRKAVLQALFFVSHSLAGVALSNEPFVKRDSLNNIPQGWKFHGPAPLDDEITLRIGLKQHGVDELVGTLYEISDPENIRYGEYLTKEEVDALVQPHPTSIAVVDDWLQAHDVDLSDVSRSSAKDWITLSLPISIVTKLVNASYSIFTHERSGNMIVRSLEYSLPASVSDHIDCIHPTTFFSFPSISPSLKTRSMTQSSPPTAKNSTACGPDSVSQMTPACLMELYRFDKYIPSSTATNKLGVVSYFGDFLREDDLQSFFQQFRKDAVNSTFSIQSVTGGITSSNFTGSEAALDIEYAMSLTFPTPVSIYSVGNDGPASTKNGDNEQFLDWALFVLNQTNPPQVFSTSYADTESAIPQEYADRLCTSFAQLGARGISVIFGSGDTGVDNDVACDAITDKTPFEPSFPGGCPFLTSVGGTASFNPEVGVGGPVFPNSNYRASGAGFSNYFPRPKYQDKAVSAYLSALGSTYEGLYNRTGRAYPDISAQSVTFAIVDNGELDADSGTSASGPVVAAIIALLNDYRLSQGKAPLGFLNPWLYSKGFQGLNDILLGQSEGCNGRGFNASKGWDPVTGLGTPDFIKLQKLLP